MTKEKLDNLRELRKEIPMWQEALKNCTDEKTEKAIEKHLSEIVETEREVTKYILEYPDPLTRQLLYLRCVKRLNWNAIAYRIGGGNTADSVRKMYERFKP
ncbi:MAG: hypothetical protein J6C96_12565 [Oscillospiraceae bacterium]|nr:hypothetical protein [Oscillospiraceae bacterium]